MASINSIVFDIGRVLVDFSYDGFQQFLVEHGGHFASKEDFIAKTDLLRYEAGQISSSAFLENVSTLLDRRPSREVLIAQWGSIFTPNEKMLGLLDTLAKRRQVVLLSNTNELHWQFLTSAYNLAERAHGAMTSFQAGAMKPNAAIFYKTAESFNLRPETTVLIDDIAEHVEAAKALGWHGIVHTELSTTVLQLAELGVHIDDTA